MFFGNRIIDLLIAIMESSLFGSVVSFKAGINKKENNEGKTTIENILSPFELIKAFGNSLTIKNKGLPGKKQKKNRTRLETPSKNSFSLTLPSFTKSLSQFIKMRKFLIIQKLTNKENPSPT